MREKQRLDQLMVQQGLAEDQKIAGAMVLAGKVLVNGQRVEKPGSRYPGNAVINLRLGKRFVSRGGEKLQGALEAFAIDPCGWTCVDIGASTGGFTDCLLQHGAARVYAVDVGYGILDWKLRQDERVVVLERINARYLTPQLVPERLDLAVMDASFISLERLLPPLLPLFGPEIRIIALVKPQFELSSAKVGEGGVVTSAIHRQEAVAKIIGCAEGLGLRCAGMEPSVIKGARGNQEYVLLLTGHG